MHSKIYNFLLRLFNGTKNVELKLQLAKFIGNYAAWNYIGKLREPVIENFFRELGKDLIEPNERMIPGDRERILHVFTQTFTTGGHTRLGQNIVENDTEREHHLVTTNQSSIEENKDFINIVKRSGGEYTRIDKEDLLLKAKILRKLALDVDKVFLYVNVDDTVPSIALQNMPPSIEVIFINHSDHTFSFGFDVAHKVVNIREEAHRITVHLRQHPNSFVLPLLISKRSVSSGTSEIRKQLNIPHNGILAISMGTTFKFKPNFKYDFFKTILQALDENSNLYLFIIGFKEEDFLREFDHPVHDRLHFLGLTTNPQDYLNAAEIFIDPMPFGSYTALLETALYGAYPLVCFDTIPLFSFYEYPLFEGIFEVDTNEIEYLHHLRNVCNNPKLRNDTRIAQAIEKHHGIVNWRTTYENILSILEISTETPEPKNIRFEELNHSTEEIKKSLLVFLYANAKSFSKLTILKIVLFLIMNRFEKREILGILKKNVTN